MIERRENPFCSHHVDFSNKLQSEDRQALLEKAIELRVEEEEVKGDE